MRRFQVSILALILVTVACALAFTALRTASDLWLSALYTFTTVLLLVAVIAARFRRGNEKAFWFGFGVFGWGFFVLGMGPWPTPTDDGPNDMRIPLNRNLLTSRVIDFVVPYLTQTDDLGTVNEATKNAMGIAHLLITLTIAIGGGIIATLVRRRHGRLISVKSLTVVAALAVATAVAASVAFARPTQYFPDSLFGARDFGVAWYTSHLAAMGERSLWVLASRDRDATAYRLLWLPSFHHPICVRVDRTGVGARLRVKVLDGKGGYDPGHLAIDKSIALSAGQVRELDRHLELAAFWKMPTNIILDRGVDDGDHLIIEGVKEGIYHVVARVLLDRAYTELCQQVLNLTGLKLGEVWEGYHPSHDQPEM
jgi:hypothetical protein